MRFVAYGFTCGLFELVVQDDQIARTRLHFFFKAVDLCLQRLRGAESLNAGLGADDGVEKDHGPKSAANAVQEREREDFDGSTTWCHWARSVRSFWYLAYCDKSKLDSGFA